MTLTSPTNGTRRPGTRRPRVVNSPAWADKTSLSTSQFPIPSTSNQQPATSATSNITSSSNTSELCSKSCDFLALSSNNNTGATGPVLDLKLKLNLDLNLNLGKLWRNQKVSLLD